MPKLVVKCNHCGELILQPYVEHTIQRCPACGRTMSLDVVDLSDQPEKLRQLKPNQRRPQPKGLDV
jgi:acetyl-CoA carboxylase beta subunit